MTHIRWDRTASVTDITLPIQARIKDKFRGDLVLTTWAASVGFLVGGGIHIDIERPQLTMAAAAQLGKDRTVRFAKLGADSLTYADGRLYVKRPYIQDLEYRQTVGGSPAIWLKVRSVDLRELNLDTAAGPDVLIPSLDIADAWISLDLAALRKKPTVTKQAATDPEKSTPPPPPSAFDVRQLRPVVDELNGWVIAVVYLSANIWDRKDIRIGSEADPLVVPILHGAVDIPTFERNIRYKVKATDIGTKRVALRPWVVTWEARDPILRLDGPQLQLGIYYINPPDVEKGNDPKGRNRPATLLWKPIVTWDLHRADLRRAWSDRFALWAAIFDMHEEPAKPGAPEDPDVKLLKETLEIRKVDAKLSVRNAGPLPVTIGSDAVRGTVTLSDKALLNLRVSGGIPAVTPPPQRPGTNPGALSLGLDALKIDAVDLTLYDYGSPAAPGELPPIKSMSHVETGRISITEMADASLTFDNVFTPHRLVATIKRAHADRIRWFRY